MKTLKSNIYISALVPHLYNENWHVREETLRAMIVCLLETNDRELNLDYLTLVNAVSRLLDDEKAKVRFAAVETLATLVRVGNKVAAIETLFETVPLPVYQALCDRFERGMLPFVSEKGLVEFPFLENGNPGAQSIVSTPTLMRR